MSGVGGGGAGGVGVGGGNGSQSGGSGSVFYTLPSTLLPLLLPTSLLPSFLPTLLPTLLPSLHASLLDASLLAPSALTTWALALWSWCWPYALIAVNVLLSNATQHVALQTVDAHGTVATSLTIAVSRFASLVLSTTRASTRALSTTRDDLRSSGSGRGSKRVSSSSSLLAARQSVEGRRAHDSSAASLVLPGLLVLCGSFLFNACAQGNAAGNAEGNAAGNAKGEQPSTGMTRWWQATQQAKALVQKLQPLRAESAVEEGGEAELLLVAPTPSTPTAMRRVVMVRAAGASRKALCAK